MTKRTLHLRRETLGALSDDDLSGVVGGALTKPGGGPSCDGLLACDLTAASRLCVVASLPQCVTRTMLPTCECPSIPAC